MELQSTFAAAGPVIMGETFHIDDLLDFSNEDIAGPIGEDLLSSLDSTVTEVETLSSGIPSLAGTKHKLDGDDVVAGDLCVPCDDLAELEWLSKFVEDSFSMGEVTRPVTSSGALTVSTDVPIEPYTNKDRDRFQSASPVSVLESSASSERASNIYRELSVPGRARSKRARTGGRVWGTTARILSSSSNSGSGSGSGNDTESLSSDSNAMTGGGSSPSQTVSVDSQAPPSAMIAPTAVSSSAKKSSKAGKSGKKGQDASQPWRCMHCSTQRTPQWRAGPMGPKTLCNACGVRYKSGRLLPEYRPAGSPGYIGHKHSNSHRKILEMRRQREQQHQHQQAQSQTSSILSSSSCQVSPNNHLLELEDPDICNSQS